MLSRTVDNNFDDEPAMRHIFEANLVGKLVKGKRVLDVGCWTGQFLSLIQNKADCYGIDPGKDAIYFAQKNRIGTYSVGSALDIPYGKESFDVVTMWDVIEHIPRNTEPIAFKEVSRVLKKDGIFALSTVTDHPISVLLDPAYFLSGHRHYSEKQLRHFFEQEGLDIMKVVYTGALWTIFRSNMELVAKHIFHQKFYFSWLEELVRKEHQDKGFNEISIIARKSDK